MARKNIDPFAENDDDNAEGEVVNFNAKLTGATKESEGGEDEEAFPGGEESITPVITSPGVDEEEILAVEPEPTKPRDGRRQERSQLFSAYEGQRDENERLKERLAALEARVAAPVAPAPGTPAVDPTDEQITMLQQQQQDIHTQWNVRERIGLNEVQQVSLRDRARKVDDKLNELRFEKQARRMGLAPAESQEVQTQRNLAARLREDNPDVYGDQYAHQYALGLYAKHRRRGEAESMALHDRVMQETRKELGMGSRERRPGPTDEQRHRYAGRSRGGGKGVPKGSIVMTEERKNMADEAFSHIPDERKRHQRWAQTVGKRLIASGKA